MKKSVGPKVKVKGKAAGGVRTLNQLIAGQAADSTSSEATATAVIMEKVVKRYA